MTNIPSESKVLDVFRMYIGLKLHFKVESSFIYSDSFGSEKINEYSMNKRKDIDTFIKVAGTIDDLSVLKQMMITMFRNDKDAWIGTVISKGNEAKNKTRMTTINSLKRVLEKDISLIEDYLIVNKCSINDIIKFNGDRPIIVKSIKISDETIALLDFKFNFLGQETNNPLWKKRSASLAKYKYLIDNHDSFSDLFSSLK